MNSDLPFSTSISLAVVTYNQADLLTGFLERWLKFGSARVALTVVDDGSDDATPKILRAWARRPRLRMHRIPHSSIAKARNHALREAPTPWLAFSDTDCILDERYFDILPSLPDRFRNDPAVEGAVVPPPGPKPPFTHSMFNVQGGTFATANMVFHVPTLLELGGFDEAFLNFREDSDLALTLLEHRGSIPFCPDLQVIHPHLERKFLFSLRRAMSMQERLIRSEMRLFQKHPVSYRRLRHFPDAYGTVRNWCWKYSALHARECRNYLFHSQGLSRMEMLRGWARALQAMVVAGFEQFCVILVSAKQANSLSKLRAR